MNDSAGPAAGWYDDPTMVNTRRYWDGARWTEHRQESAPSAAAQPGRATKVELPKPSGWVQVGYIFAVVLPIVGIVIGLILLRTEPGWGKKVIGLSVVVMVVYGVLVATGVIHPTWS